MDYALLDLGWTTNKHVSNIFSTSPLSSDMIKSTLFKYANFKI